MKKIITLIIGAILPLAALAQMDADACHFWSDWSLYNPGNIKPYNAGTLLLRGQQIGFNGQPYTVAANFSFFNAKLSSQFGGEIRFDHAGYTSTAKVDFRYAYSIGSDYDRVNLGLSGGISYLNYDLDKVIVDNTSDELAFSEEEKHLKPNYNFGVEWIHRVDKEYAEADELSVGGSILNLEDFLSRKAFRNTINSMYLYAAYRHRTIHHFDWLGGALFNYYDTNRSQVELHGAAILTAADDGGLDTYDKVAVGVSYRHNVQGYGNNDMTINAGWGITKHFHIGYAFDFVVEDNVKKPYSTHELILQYRFVNRKCVNGRFSGTKGFMPYGGR
ncbi:MAG: PorP/SprF family type IX secretion system membrane protein [Paludibacteraceae bacterium]|nr:PorP/SprF family type IX secretion system membrane protein [Paludibacteraceae bacterium]MBR4713836.1 PorP/SprF family type IX secretion system membrane protein [Paludibacteraceae bacterium]